MPLYKTLEPNSQTTVKIWHITESYNSLFEGLNLNDESLSRVNNMKSDLHRRGFLSVRHLLRTVNYTDKDLYYDAFGKPHLKDGKHISITHSFVYSAIIVSDNPVGIDIEKQREKIKRIAHKFVGYEQQYLNKDKTDYVRSLTAIWCVKESLYKLFAQPGLSFKQHTLVIPFTFEDRTTKCWILYKDVKKDYTSEYFEFDGFTCAFVT